MRTCAECSIQYPDALEYCPRDGSKLATSTRQFFDPLIGTTIDGRYLVEALLGQGGMGFVYGGRHAIIDKRVAIKVLRKEAAKDEASAQRFLAEAKAASKIGHQNIVDITDFGVLADGHPFFVMEFLDGPTLAKIVETEGQLPPLRAIAIADQIARGLAAAHQKGIIHRDLKPENVFVLERDGNSDVIKIVDFGIAKDTASTKRLTQVGMVLGTPEYMSPEQATGQPTDHRVDMYALGCILYEMIVGDVPFKDESATRTLTKHVFEPVVPPSVRRPELAVPPSLEAIVMRMLEKKPGDRYADLRELIGEFERADRDLRAGVTTPRPAASPKSGITHVAAPEEVDAPPPRSRAPLWIGVGGVIGGGALIGLLLVGAHKAAPAPVKAPAVTAPVMPPVAVAPPPVAAPVVPATAFLVLRTTPIGATVYSGNEQLGVSPLTLARPKGTAPLTFTFRQNGYHDAARQVVPDHDQEIDVTLSKSPPIHATNHLASANKTAAPPATATSTKPQRKHPSELRNPFE